MDFWMYGVGGLVLAVFALYVARKRPKPKKQDNDDIYPMW